MRKAYLCLLLLIIVGHWVPTLPPNSLGLPIYGLLLEWSHTHPTTQHLPLGFLTTLCIYMLSKTTKKPRRQTLLISIGLSASLEISQILLPVRVVDPLDLLWALIGSLSFLSLTLIIPKRKPESEENLPPHPRISGGVIISMTPAIVIPKDLPRNTPSGSESSCRRN